MNLCLERWTRAYNLHHHSLNVHHSNQEEASSSSTISISTSQDMKKAPTAQEKFRQAMISAKKICQLISLSSQSEFPQKLELLDKLFLHWNNGDDVELIGRNLVNFFT